MEQQTWLTGIALRCCDWSERWFPDPYIFVALGVIVVGLMAAAIGVSPAATANAFGDGFWSLIPFTMQMCFIIIGGYAVAASPSVARIIDMLARLPRSGRGAVAYVALISMLVSLLHWGLSLIFAGLLVRALARREDWRMDYRAASAAAYLGLGAVWALGLSSSAAQLQANPASMTPALLAITGVIPFTETIFLPQSLLLAGILVLISVGIAWLSAPKGPGIRTAAMLGVDINVEQTPLPPRTRPGDWLERSPVLTLLLAALGTGWLTSEISSK